MIDIVERLRLASRYSSILRQSEQIVSEAADEIERLRHEVKVREQTCTLYERLLQEADAEIERLRQENLELNTFLGSTKQIANEAAAEIERLREHHKTAVDNWTLEAQIVKQQEDEIHGLKAEIERLREERDRLAWSLAVCGVIAREGDGTCLPEYETDSVVAVRQMRAELERLRSHITKVEACKKDEVIELREEIERLHDQADRDRVVINVTYIAQRDLRDEAAQLRKLLQELIDGDGTTAEYLKRVREALGNRDE